MCLACHASLQRLPAKIGTSRATAAASGRPLHFPELALLETHPTHKESISVGVLWCKATILASFYGHVTPHRPSWLVSLTHPDHLSGRCGAAQCRQQGCSGNRLERAADGNYTLVVPHHKTSTTSSGPTLITYPLPPSMFIWMDVWLLWCWPLFAKQASVSQPAAVAAAVMLAATVHSKWLLTFSHSHVLLQGTTTVFCTLAEGVPISPSRLTQLMNVSRRPLPPAAVPCKCSASHHPSQE